MEVNGSRGAIQIKHKKQSSHDSGTFLDWDETVTHNVNIRSEALDNRPVFNSNVTGEFVTVVAVEAKDGTDQVDGPNNNFVTVLTVNTATNKIQNDGKDMEIMMKSCYQMGVDKNTVESAVSKIITNGENVSPNENIVRSYSDVNEQVNGFVIASQECYELNAQFMEREILVYRLPGERLGFGLKFEGGLQTNQKVSQLFVQSCAADSPASRTRTPWGNFCPGDEIVQINDIRITDLTRIDCVKFLKESTVVLKLLVRHLRSPDDVPNENYDQTQNMNVEISQRIKSGLSESGKAELTNNNVVNITNNDNIQSGSNYSDSTRSSPTNETGKSETSSPPPIPPRKLLKKSSNTSFGEKRRTSPKASPRSLVNPNSDNRQVVNKENYVNTKIIDKALAPNKQNTFENKHSDERKHQELYEVDLKLSDEDIDEVIESLDKTETEEAMRNHEVVSGNISEGLQFNEPVYGKPMLDLNYNEQSTGVSHHAYHSGTHHHSGVVRSDSEVPEAEFYTNLFLDNDNFFESESDDTGSSHTTAIDRLSIHSSDRISLTSSSSFSDIKSLNSYELDIETNIETIIDFDKVLEPLEGSVETLPIVSAVPKAGTEALYGPFVLKNVKHEEQIRVSQRSDQSEKIVTDIGRGVESNHSQNVQDVSKIKSQTEMSVQSPKPLPRTEMQKLKFKSGKKMPPPPPPPGKKEDIVNKNINVKSTIAEETSQQEKEMLTLQDTRKTVENTTEKAKNTTISSCEKISTHTAQTEVEQTKIKTSEIRYESAGATECEMSLQEKTQKISKTSDSLSPEESTKQPNESTGSDLYTTVEQIPIVENLLPKVINAQEKVPAESTSPTYKSPSDLPFLETIVENDEHHNHLPRLIDFVPKDKVKSLSPEKSKKLNSIIYEQQKVVEYFTTPHTTPNKNQGKTNKPIERNENSITTKANRSSPSSSPTQTSPTRQKGHSVNEISGIANEAPDKVNLENKEGVHKTKSVSSDTSKSQDVLNSTDNSIEKSAEILERTDLDVISEKELILLKNIDRRADGGEHVSTVPDGNDEHEAIKEINRR